MSIKFPAEPIVERPAELLISIPHDRIAQFCQHNHILKLSLFGSVLRSDFRPESDIDILVEFEPGKTPGFRIVTLQEELSELFGGRTVDLRTPNELSRYIRERVLAEASVQYVRN